MQRRRFQSTLLRPKKTGTQATNLNIAKPSAQTTQSRQQPIPKKAITKINDPDEQKKTELSEGTSGVSSDEESISSFDEEPREEDHSTPYSRTPDKLSQASSSGQLNLQTLSQKLSRERSIATCKLDADEQPPKMKSKATTQSPPEEINTTSQVLASSSREVDHDGSRQLSLSQKISPLSNILGCHNQL